MTLWYILLMLGMACGAFVLARGRAAGLAERQALHSRPGYFGALAFAQVLLPMLVVLALGNALAAPWLETATLTALDPALLETPFKRAATYRDIRALAAGQPLFGATDALRAASAHHASLARMADGSIAALGISAGLAGLLFALRRVTPEFRARNRFESLVAGLLFTCAGIAVLTTLGIVLSVLFETLHFFQKVPPAEFLFGTHWSPQQALRADQGGGQGAFGIAPLVAGTLLISLIAMLVAGPIGLLAAIYMAEYASPRFRAIAKPLLEILAGIPTVVLGFFAALTVAPFIRNAGASVGLGIASESALAAGLVMGMMIIPFVSSLSDDVISAVPQSLRDGALALGATRAETIVRVVLPAALPGIVSAFMLAISRAVGETMIVVMAAGLAANLTFNPLEAVTTFTVQIKTILVGDQEFDSAKTLAAFALGFVLFFFTLTLNVIALAIVRKYREHYE